MSTDPKSGIVYLTMYEKTAAGLTDGAQFSGVLIAPDEVLTAAHCVTAHDGSFRNYGDAFPGYTGTPAGATDVKISGVHALDNSHGAVVSDSQIGTDYAVIHLSQPVTGAQVFAMGVGTSGGAVTVDGYPAIGRGILTEVQETVTPGSAYGEVNGANISGTGNPAGASGGPVWSIVNGNPTVTALVSATDPTTNIMGFKALAQADINQIDAWVYADDQGQSWAANYAPQPVATGPSGTTSTVAADRLAMLADQLSAASATTSGPRSALMAATASALVAADQDGHTGFDAGTAQDVARTLRGESPTPKRAVGFAAGVMAAESGARGNGVLSYIANVFHISLDQTGRQAAISGSAEGQLLKNVSTDAFISGTSVTLASASQETSSMPLVDKSRPMADAGLLHNLVSADAHFSGGFRH